MKKLEKLDNLNILNEVESSYISGGQRSSTCWSLENTCNQTSGCEDRHYTRSVDGITTVDKTEDIC